MKMTARQSAGSIRSSALHACHNLLKSASLLEIPGEHIEFLERSAVVIRKINRCNHATGAYRREWDEIYRGSGRDNPSYDFWLERYEKALQESKDLPVIDLGCGYGNDSIYLAGRGFHVVSCDYSEEALKRLSTFIDCPSTLRFDMVEGLPFFDSSSRLVIANLSLHYFSWADTGEIAADIKRVLTKGGHLLCRVNSVSDREHGAGQGTCIENNFYTIKGKRKRFFDKSQLTELFQGWNIRYLEEKCIERFGKKKFLWELAARKQ